MPPPPPRKRSRGPMPDPMSALLPLGEHASRTAVALVGLSTQLINFPETYYAQELIAESVVHEILSAQQTSWHNGIKHGKWLAAKEIKKCRGGREVGVQGSRDASRDSGRVCAQREVVRAK